MIDDIEHYKKVLEERTKEYLDTIKTADYFYNACLYRDKIIIEQENELKKLKLNPLQDTLNNMCILELVELKFDIDNVIKSKCKHVSTYEKSDKYGADIYCNDCKKYLGHKNDPGL